jgi:cytochrome P450
LREEAPVAWVDLPGPTGGAYLISRKADLEFVAKHPELFSSEVGHEVWRWGGDLGPELSPIIRDGGYDLVHTIVSSDPPRAHRYRKIALEALGPSRIKARISQLQGIVDALLAALPEGEPVDFRERFAVPFPLKAILAVFGLGPDEEDSIYQASCALLSLVDPITPIEQAKRDLATIVSTQKLLAPLIERYRAEPAENFLSFVANARDENGELLSMAEALSMAFVTLAGGNETTRNTLASAAFELVRDRSLWDKLVADPARVTAFVDEIVRFSSPATVTARQVAQDTSLGGIVMEKGAAVFMLWGSGSHDETAFECPGEIRLDRANGRTHTSFGAGVHHCAGITLARTEIEMSVRSWLATFERMELAVPEAEVRYDPVFAIRALYALPLILTRRAGGEVR